MRTRMPEIRTVPVADIEIPMELSRLYDLVYNLWWTWSSRAHLLFSSIDPVRWIRYRNPVELLINVEPHRWEPLLLDENFMSSYEAVVEAFDDYLAGSDTSWFRRTFPDYDAGPFAYFSTEFGWHESLGIYSGGLGVLSGDHCKSASDLGLPFVGVGLLYRRGYFLQTVDADGEQQHFYPDFDVRRLPVLPIVGPGGKEVRVSVELLERKVHLRLWKATIGRVPVVLLDSDVRENAPADRQITSILYVRGREMRLCQEIILGIGGVHALRALGIEPAVWHLNEGHSVFASLERLREKVLKERLPFAEALRRVADNAVFTTHTPVPAGNEVFDAPLVREYFEDCAKRCGVPVDDLLALGRATPDRDDGQFNLTALAIRTTRQTNGVSELHGRVADKMWRHLWPKTDDAAGEQRITHITNGVHVPTWLGPELGDLLRRRLGSGFLSRLLDPGFGEAVMAIPDAEFFEAHQAQKKRLIDFARERLIGQFARHGRSPKELRQLESLMDPAVLTLGFGRRFATYKRADLMFHDPGRLRSILTASGRPVQILFAGKAHPADRPGQELIRRIFEASLTPALEGRIVFIENYDMRVARRMVQGVDVWLNTPSRPHEASGTSGMKVAVNGGLNFSVLDGWWCEGYDRSHGWVIGSGQDNPDLAAQNREDAASFYQVLAGEIVPCFYRQDPASGLPVEWIARMKRALAKLTPRFSTERMLRDYARKAYLPAALGEEPGAAIQESQFWQP
ncbi:MAG: alpha-glucan family phosphorylase [Acidobacteriia bacterium]|nr:alpha-glucan family phosphorylase [Terriglobia bacterium]